MEIYFSGTWGTITDSNWTSDDAQVVCRKLGHFKPGAKVYKAIGDQSEIFCLPTVYI